MKTNLVTIIMPAYNGESYVEQAIQSVIAQTHANWELIIVDDGSTDSTAKIVACFQDSRIHYIYQVNQGQAAALNHGLELAQGEYITTLDVDDWLTENSLLDRVIFLNEHPEFGAVYGDGVYCDVKGEALRRFSDQWHTKITGDVYGVLISSPFFGTGANVMVRSKVFEQHGLRYDESLIWCQDYDIYIRIAEKEAFGVIDSPTVWYRLHQMNMTMTTSWGRRMESLFRTKMKVLVSPRFTGIKSDLQYKFFYQLLFSDLPGLANDQRSVINNFMFQRLSRPQQSKLLRLVAISHLLLGENLTFAKELLQKAIVLTPFDPKTVMVAILAMWNIDITKSAVQFWRRIESRRAPYTSVIELARRP